MHITTDAGDGGPWEWRPDTLFFTFPQVVVR